MAMNPPRGAQWNNPAWVAKTLARTFEEIETSQIPKQWMPKLEQVKARGETIIARNKELGCGAYGCALPTLDPKIVLKVTTDSTEAEFAAKISPTLVVPICVKYEAAMMLPYEHQGRPIALLWREEAKDIGKLKGHADQLVGDQHVTAQAAFDLILAFQQGDTSSEEMMATVKRWTESLQAMTSNSELEWLATGMLTVYAKQGVFFGDIHAGNLGKCMRDDKMRWVITDPGHVVVIGDAPRALL
jgi:hypothetical protein